jgi:hypothetical protein
MNEQRSSPGEFITIVSGLPRSGTSLMMQMLSAGGLPALTDSLRQPDESNPRGYFEFEPVKQLGKDKAWLEQASGRAVKIIHLLLRELPVDGQYHYRVIFMRRPIQEILASQHAMLKREGKTGADPAALAKIYTSQLEQVEKWLGAQSAFSSLPVEYHHVLREPRESAAAINAFLGGNLDPEAMAQSVDPTLYRQRGGSSAEEKRSV